MKRNENEGTVPPGTVLDGSLFERGVVGTHGYFLTNVGDAFDYILAFEDIMGASRIM